MERLSLARKLRLFAVDRVTTRVDSPSAEIGSVSLESPYPVIPSARAVFRRSSGREALAAWLRGRAKAAERIVVLEEALLTGHFARYAARRLGAFGLSRAAGIFVHLVELTWLFEIFSAKPFIASIALQNVTLVVDAFFWGALESLRRRVRQLGPTSESAALVARWMTIASWVGLAAVVLPVGVAVFGEREHAMLHVYAIACGVRLAADVILRTYYSGVFAYARVHRPIWSTLVSPFLVIGITVLLWDIAGGWSFVAALFVSLLASRTLLFVFTSRAYRRFRVPRPRVRPFTRGALGIVDRDLLLAGAANLSTRLGGVVLLAALVPSLTSIDGPDDEPVVEPFAFALHLAAPFLLVASQWAFVFYHDWKRVERAEATRLAMLLDRRLTAAAVAIGIVSSVTASLLVLLYVPWSESWPTLASLFIATIGISIWTSFQLRRFSHGEHLHQAVSAGALVIVVGIALSVEDLGVVAFYIALAVGPWAAIGLNFVLGHLLRREAHGVLGSVAAFVHATSRAKGDVIVWDAVVEARSVTIAERVATRLGARGAVIRGRNRIVWFERAPASSRADWLALGAGRIRSLVRLEVPHGGAKAALAARGVVAEPDPGRDLERLAAEHATLFPDGFVLRLGAPPPARFLELGAAVRQAIWRDALRFNVGARGRSGWFVSCRTRDGAPEAIFAARRPVRPEQAAAWRAAVLAADWRLGADGGAIPTSPRHSNRDAGVKVSGDEGIVEA